MRRVAAVPGGVEVPEGVGLHAVDERLHQIAEPPHDRLFVPGDAIDGGELGELLSQASLY
jgi:hypothetical protein